LVDEVHFFVERLALIDCSSKMKKGHFSRLQVLKCLANPDKPLPQYAAAIVKKQSPLFFVTTSSYWASMKPSLSGPLAQRGAFLHDIGL